MVDVGLVVLRGSRSVIEQKLPTLFQNVLPQVRTKLYVKLDVALQDDLFELVPIIYRSASTVDRPSVDLRVLLDRRRALKIDHVFEERAEGIYTPEKRDNWPGNVCVYSKKLHNSVVLGGTFDRLHNGHKVLLSTALLLTNKILTCGVTTGDMNKKKKLWELIEPVDRRCAVVSEFVADVSDEIECRAVPIVDPFGPSIVDPDMECIVVSEETLKGGHMVNEKRIEKGLSKLDIRIVKLIEADDAILQETKVSSSSRRRELLGTILREPSAKRAKHTVGDAPRYVIGLTGGIASGKTHIAQYLLNYGCEVIDCDKLGHELYAESRELREKLVETFGVTILEDNGQKINRRVLGPIVFGNKQEMEKLNRIVWPLIAKKVQERIANSTRRVVIVDAAVMIEAGWEALVDQVWTTFVPKEEAVKRVCARDKLTPEQAENRVNSQISNFERISRSNIVFCTLWDYAQTESQVQRALNVINEKYV